MLAILLSCNSNPNNSSNTQVSANPVYEGEDAHITFDDGEYCALVEYFNPNTGTSSEYQLSVEVKNGELVLIKWPNGGWLDESHFTPEEIDEDGRTEFTSDKGYQYTISIQSRDPCEISSRNNQFQNDEVDLAKEQADEEESKRTHKDEEEGVVIWDYNSCDYIIIETRGWYVVAEKRMGSYFLDSGDRVRGDLTSYGFKDVYALSKDDEVRLYIDNYHSSKEDALKNVIEKCQIELEEEN